MPVELIEEREEPRLRLVEPARDIEAEVEAARQEGYAHGVAQAKQHYEGLLAQKAPRAPMAVEMIPVLEAIAALVGVRVMLAVSVAMTFALAWKAMAAPSVAQIVVLVVFGVAAVGPLAWLAQRRTG